MRVDVVGLAGVVALAAGIAIGTVGAAVLLLRATASVLAGWLWRRRRPERARPAARRSDLAA